MTNAALQVLYAIQQAGWLSDGATDVFIVKRSDGSLGMNGGRLRFRKPETLRRVTVGAFTVAFYTLGEGIGLHTKGKKFKTSELQKILKELE